LDIGDIGSEIHQPGPVEAAQSFVGGQPDHPAIILSDRVYPLGVETFGCAQFREQNTR
jgi:hypothetical protein